jgi:serine/threonine-protein kinase
MAVVHYGRLIGAAGFSRTVAIKRMHAHLSRNPEFVAMFLDEARLAARVRHPNVVQTLDVVCTDGEIFLVMEHILGESLSKLRHAMNSNGTRAEPNVVATIMVGVLRGLHAAHEARGEDGRPLDIVHRDVSPQNVLVGVDGIARVLDFGVAKAVGRAQTTRNGQIKGKLAYMAPEQLLNQRVTRQSDVYAAAVVAWEMLTGERLFRAESEGALIAAILDKILEPPSKLAPHVPEAFDRVIMRGLERDPQRRYATAREMASDLEACAPGVSLSIVGEWVEALAAPELARRAAELAELDSKSRSGIHADALSSRSEESTKVERAEAPTNAPPGDDRSQTSHVVITPARSSSSSNEMRRAATLVGPMLMAAAAALAALLILPRSSAAPRVASAEAPPAASGALNVSALREESTFAAPPRRAEQPAAIDLDEGFSSAAPRASEKQPDMPLAHAPTTRVKPAGAPCDPPFTIDARVTNITRRAAYEERLRARLVRLRPIRSPRPTRLRPGGGVRREGAVRGGVRARPGPAGRKLVHGRATSFRALRRGNLPQPTPRRLRRVAR